MNAQRRRRLARSLGYVDATAIGLGAIIGAGVFVAIGPAVGVAGSAALIALVIAGFVALFNSLSSAQLAAVYPESGGTYVYGREVINDLTGFTAGWTFLIAAIAADSAIALTFAAYLDFLFPAISARAIAVIIALAVTLVNYAGMKYSAEVNNVMVVIKVGVLVLFIALGAFFFKAARLAPFHAEAAGVLRAAAILFFAYTGYSRVATLGEEVKDPQKTIPRAILSALGISAWLYLGTLFIALGLVGAGRLAASEAPLALAMKDTGVHWSVYAVAAGALVATSSVFLTDLLGISRVVFAMARNGDLPRFLSAVHGKFGTPHRAVLTSGIAVALLTAFLPLRNLVEAGSFGLLLYYAITNLAAVKLPKERRRYHKALGAVGLVSCIGLAVFLPWRTIMLELIVIAVGIAYFIAMRAISSRRRHARSAESSRG
jgi:APA family basic amino acid/polyamine antiporter